MAGTRAYKLRGEHHPFSLNTNAVDQLDVDPAIRTLACFCVAFSEYYHRRFNQRLAQTLFGPNGISLRLDTIAGGATGGPVGAGSSSATKSRHHRLLNRSCAPLKTIRPRTVSFEWPWWPRLDQAGLRIQEFRFSGSTGPSGVWIYGSLAGVGSAHDETKRLCKLKSARRNSLHRSRLLRKRESRMSWRWRDLVVLTFLVLLLGAAMIANVSDGPMSEYRGSWVGRASRF